MLLVGLLFGCTPSDDTDPSIMERSEPHTSRMDLEEALSLIHQCATLESYSGGTDGQTIHIDGLRTIRVTLPKTGLYMAGCGKFSNILGKRLELMRTENYSELIDLNGKIATQLVFRDFIYKNGEHFAILRKNADGKVIPLVMSWGNTSYLAPFLEDALIGDSLASEV